MISKTNEKALEACIERHLTGGVSDMAGPGGDWNEDAAAYQSARGAGYRRGRHADFNAEFSIDEAMFWRFLETTQPAELAKLHHKADWKKQVVERLHRKLKKDGILAVLRKGLDVDNAHLTLFYRLPYNDLNPEVAARFESNLFSVTRQVLFSRTGHQSVDMVVFLNGPTRRAAGKRGSINLRTRTRAFERKHRAGSGRHRTRAGECQSPRIPWRR